MICVNYSSVYCVTVSVKSPPIPEQVFLNETERSAGP